MIADSPEAIIFVFHIATIKSITIELSAESWPNGVSQFMRLGGGKMGAPVAPNGQLWLIHRICLLDGPLDN